MKTNRSNLSFIFSAPLRRGFFALKNIFLIEIFLSEVHTKMIDYFDLFTIDDYAMEGVDRDKTSCILRNAFYDKICKSLSVKANQDMLFRYIANFRNKFINVLSSPLITTNIPFNHAGADADIVFKACGVDRNEVDAAIKETKKVIKLDQVGKNVTAFNVCMIMAISYFMNDVNKVNALMLYYVCGFYYRMYSGSFKTFAPNQECMQYTVDNLTFKFLLKQYGSMEKAIVASMTTGFQLFKKSGIMKSLTDYEICSVIIPNFRSRVSGMFRSVVNEYMKNYESGNKIFTEVERNAEGEFIIDREINISRIEQLSNKYTLKFYSDPINLGIINMIGNMITDISANELRTAVQYVHDDSKSTSLRVFYQSIFTAFFNDYPDAKSDDIQSMKFLAAANAIYKKGNSKDPSILNIKNISHDWLKHGSAAYKATSRVATQNLYRKAIYLYFVMLITNA